MNISSGVMIIKVIAGSPGHKAGLHLEDIILEIDGNAIRTPAELLNAIFERKPGENIHLKLLRNGARMELDIAATTIPARPFIVR
jgi:S1-C subfamily serine protease